MTDKTPTRVEVVAGDGNRALAICFDASGDAPVVLFMPAMGVEASYYEGFACSLQSAGLNVVVHELRGTGSSSVRASRVSDFGYRELIEQDWPAAIELTRARHPGSKLVMMGHSLGGQITCLQQARGDRAQRADAMVMLTCCGAHHRAYPFPRSIGVGLGTQLAGLIALTLGYFPGHRLGFGGRQGRTIIADWCREARLGFHRVQGDPSDYRALLSRLDIPALSISFQGDGLAPRAAVDDMASRLAAGCVERWHLTAAELQLPQVDHFRWVRGSAALGPRLAGWINTTLAQRDPPNIA